MGGVGGEWVGAWTRVWKGGVVLCLCKFGISVWIAGPGICVLCLADTCTSEVYPVFIPVAPYGYLLPNMYLFIADITNSDSFV